MKLLLSNDDGVMAPGLNTLYSELKSSYDATVVAPLEERSTTGHSLSLDRPLRIEKIDENIFGCSGFPGDCVLLGITHLLNEKRPDVVISGINRGANLGQDLYYSGTIGAAREAVFHHIPGIAVSLVMTSLQDKHHYDSAAKFIAFCLSHDLHLKIPKYTLININVPDMPIEKIKGCKLTEIGFRQYSEDIFVRKDARDRDYFWIAGKYMGYRNNVKSDCHAVENGHISLTPHGLIDGLNNDYSELQNIIEKLNDKYFT